MPSPTSTPALDRASSPSSLANTSPAQLLERLAAAGLQLRTTQTAFHQTGLDFAVVHAIDDDGRTWIVRTPRRDDVVVAARGEAVVLRYVAKHLAVAVPDWRVHTDEVIAYPRLAGEPVVDIVNGAVHFKFPMDAIPGPFLQDLGGVLAVFANVIKDGVKDGDVFKVDDARAAGIKVESVDDVRAAVRKDIENTRDILQPSARLWSHWQRWLDDDAMWSGPLALAHGDLHPGHWLVTDDHRLVGILDWTEAKVTDAATDLAMVYGCGGEAALSAVAQAMTSAGAPPSTTTLAHAAMRWSATPATAAAWALRTNNPGVLEQVRAQLQSIEATLT
jgi:aminoglycoside phosphotransferase (APT) family kinase protein